MGGGRLSMQVPTPQLDGLHTIGLQNETALSERVRSTQLLKTVNLKSVDNVFTHSRSFLELVATREYTDKLTTNCVTRKET